MKHKLVVGSLIAAGVIAVGAGISANQEHWLIPQALADTHAAAVSTGTQPVAVAALPDFSGIVAKYGPAVVNISVTEKAENVAYAPGQPQLDPNSPFYQFFRQFQGQMPHPEPTHALGSGFIVSPDGIILTNAHVVQGAANVTVKLTDRRAYQAKVIGMDKPSDIAVLKIHAKNLPTVKLDRANDVKVGQWVVAIGAPFGFENSATAGIVSAKSRTLPGDTYVPFLQTDVAVNPGNSGGPLFNTKGEVVGINSQIFSSDGGYEGLSFAIPIKVALNVERQLLQHGSVTRGRLGVDIQNVNQGLADSFGLKAPAGALVGSVENDGPAAKAGLKPGDVILRYDGKNIARSSQLPLLVANTAPGTVAKLEVMRNGETRQIDVTIGRLNTVKLASADVHAHAQGRLGVVVRPLTAHEQQQAGVSGGLIVEHATGPAADAGIQPGDMILSLNDTPIKSPEQFKQLLAKAGKHVALLVQRDKQTIYVPVDLG